MQTRQYLKTSLLALTLLGQQLCATDTSYYGSAAATQSISVADLEAADVVADAIIKELPLSWRIKNSVYDAVFAAVYKKNTAASKAIEELVQEWLQDKSKPHPMAPQKRDVVIVPYSEVAGFPITGIWTAETPPDQDKSFVTKIAAKLLAWALGTFSLDKEGLPSIPENHALLSALCFPPAHRALLAPPQLPREIRDCGNDIVGSCALSGPFAHYLHKVRDLNGIPLTIRNLFYRAGYPYGEVDVYRTGLPEYTNFAVKPGLETLGGEAYLLFDGYKMVTKAINYQDRWYTAGDANWNRVQKIVMATIGTDTTVIQHLLNTHLIIAGTFSAVSEKLDPVHPLRAYLHPHTLATISINNYNVPILVRPGAMFDSLYSFDNETLASVFNTKIANFHIDEMDLEKDLARRGLTGFALPGQSYPNIEIALWNTVKTFTGHYVEHYYSSDAALAADVQAVRWYNDLKTYIPNRQIDAYAPDLTRASLVNLMTMFAYTASVNHDLVGVSTYHYLAWQKEIPTQVAVDGSLPSIGKAQLAANLLFVTQPTSLATVVHNSFSDLAVDTRGKEILEGLRGSLTEFQEHLERMGVATLSTPQPKKLIPSVHS